MLLALVIISGIFWMLIVPIEATRRYYSPKQHSFLANIGWIILGIITWPLIPILLFIRKRDKSLASTFWISLLIWAVSFGYWVALNAETFLQFQQQYVM